MIILTLLLSLATPPASPPATPTVPPVVVRTLQMNPEKPRDIVGWWSGPTRRTQRLTTRRGRDPGRANKRTCAGEEG